MLTPVLDPSQAASLGVGAIALQAVQGPDGMIAQIRTHWSFTCVQQTGCERHDGGAFPTLRECASGS